MSKSLPVQAYQMLPTGHCPLRKLYFAAVRSLFCSSQTLVLQQSDSQKRNKFNSKNRVQKPLPTPERNAPSKMVWFIPQKVQHTRNCSNKLDNSFVIRPVLCLGRSPFQDKTPSTKHRANCPFPEALHCPQTDNYSRSAAEPAANGL